MDISCPSLTHGSCFGCRVKCKGQDPCTQGANVNQCAPCAALSEEQWTHLRENFAKRSAYRSRTGSQDNSFEKFDTDEPVFTGEDLSRVDDTILDLEPEQSGTSAPVTGISPLTSLPAPLPGSSQDIPATSGISGSGPVISPQGEPFSRRRPLCHRRLRRIFFLHHIHTVKEDNPWRTGWHLYPFHNLRGLHL